MRGGLVEGIYLGNIDAGQVADAAIHIDFYYKEGNTGPYKPVVRNIHVRGLTCRKSKYALYLRGYQDAPIRNVTLENCAFDGVAKPHVLEHVEELALREVKVNGMERSLSAFVPRHRLERRRGGAQRGFKTRPAAPGGAPAAPRVA